MPHYEDAKKADADMRARRGVKLSRAYVSGEKEFDDARLLVDGLGEVTIKAMLPKEIIEQIEDYYYGLFVNRLAGRAA
jgi:hypothetical protein